ncbi:MAG: hypothetical protein GF400_10770 [Candidatus Eisenbacteria bacterium]|nr:hypothetical protein [Candidatus Eisenbacteria bacterium]
MVTRSTSHAREDSVFESIAEDSTSGASSLAIRAAEELSGAAGSFASSDPGSFWDDLTAACSELLAAGRDMAPVVNLVGNVLSGAERMVLSGAAPDTVLHAVQLECQRITEFGEERLRDVGENGAGFIDEGSVVYTTSDSGSVRAVLESAARAGRRFEVVLSESRPALEGLGLARFASELRVQTTLVADAALPGLVEAGGLVLLGADSVSEGSFVNKIGSYALALAAREADVRCCVSATTDKLLPGPLRGDPTRPRDGSELLEKPPERVRPLNRYLEEVPNSLLRTLVTEDGPVAPEEIPGLLKERPVSPALLQLLYPRESAGSAG